MRPSSRGLGAVPRKPSKLEPLFLDRPESAKPVTLELELQAKFQFLLKDNERMQRQLADAYREVELLRRENQALKARLPEEGAAGAAAPGGEEEELTNNRPVTRKGDSRAVTSSTTREGTFITGGAQLPKAQCENCGKEIERANFELHSLYCRKNIKRCGFCDRPVDLRELDEHITTARGTPETLMQAVRDNDLEATKSMLAHGLPFAEIVCDEEGEERKNTPLHFAAKVFALEIAEYFVLRGLAVNVRNAFAETPLHVACAAHNQQKNSRPGRLRAFVLKLLALGADPAAKNALGDSAVLVAKRSGNHELAALLN